MRRNRYTALLAAGVTIGAGIVAVSALRAGAVPTDTTVGSLPLGAASYPVPSDALYVATTGNDANPGTVDAPFATLSKAVSVATGNRTIVLRQGSYHESVDIGLRHQVTIENYPGEAVWLDGAEPVTGWARGPGHTWYHDGWDHHFNHTAGYSDYSAGIGQWIDPKYPMAAYPDQVWVGRRWLHQVGTGTPVGWGQFYYDEADNRLVIGSDPTNLVVRASSLSTAITLHSADSTIRGIGIRRYATSIPDKGALQVWSNGVTLENDIFAQIATSAVGISGMNATINRVTAKFNGLTGIHGNEAWGLQLTNSVIRNNNREHFAADSPVQGGIKFTKSRNVLLSNNVIENNFGASGAWFDQSCYNVTVIHNRIVNNGRIGLYAEISSVFLIADNYIVDNGLEPVRIADTNQVRAWNNTLGGGTSRGFDIVQDSRKASDIHHDGHDPLRPLPDPTVTWIAGDITIANNLVGDGTQFYVYVMDQTHHRDANDMHVTLQGNLFSPQPLHHADALWGRLDHTTSKFVTSAQVNAGAPGAMNNADNSAQMTAQDLVNSSAARSAANALPLPSDIASVIGQPAGTKHLGSF